MVRLSSRPRPSRRDSMPIARRSVVAALLGLGVPVVLAAQERLVPQTTEFSLTVVGQKQGAFPGGKGGGIGGLRLTYLLKSPRDVASGLPTGKRQHSAVVFTKAVGVASPQFFSALVGGENLTSVVVTTPSGYTIKQGTTPRSRPRSEAARAVPATTPATSRSSRASNRSGCDRACTSAPRARGASTTSSTRSSTTRSTRRWPATASRIVVDAPRRRRRAASTDNGRGIPVDRSQARRTVGQRSRSCSRPCTPAGSSAARATRSPVVFTASACRSSTRCPRS